jgi:hypothetical protein
MSNILPVRLQDILHGRQSGMRELKMTAIHFSPSTAEGGLLCVIPRGRSNPAPAQAMRVMGYVSACRARFIQTGDYL